MGLDDILQVCQAAPEAKIIVTHLDAVPHALVGRKEVKDFVQKIRSLFLMMGKFVIFKGGENDNVLPHLMKCHYQMFAIIAEI